MCCSWCNSRHPVNTWLRKHDEVHRDMIGHFAIPCPQLLEKDHKWSLAWGRVYIWDLFPGDQGRVRFYRWHDSKTWPTSPTLQSTLDVSSTSPNSYASPVPAWEMLRHTAVHEIENDATLYVIFSCEATLFTHGSNLVSHTISFTIGITSGWLNMTGVSEI